MSDPSALFIYLFDYSFIVFIIFLFIYLFILFFSSLLSLQMLKTQKLHCSN